MNIVPTGAQREGCVERGRSSPSKNKRSSPSCQWRSAGTSRPTRCTPALSSRPSFSRSGLAWSRREARLGTLAARRTRRVHSASWSTRWTLTETTRRRQRGRAVRPVILDRAGTRDGGEVRTTDGRGWERERARDGRGKNADEVTATKRGRVHDARSRLYQRRPREVSPILSRPRHSVNTTRQ